MRLTQQIRVSSYLVVVVRTAVREQDGDVGTSASVAFTRHEHFRPQLAQRLGRVGRTAPVSGRRHSLLDVEPRPELVQIEDDVGAVAERHQTDLGCVVRVDVNGVDDRVYEILHDFKVFLSHAARRVQDEHNIRVPRAGCATQQSVLSLYGSTCMITVSGATILHIVFVSKYFLIEMREYKLCSQPTRMMLVFLNSCKHSPC